MTQRTWRDKFKLHKANIQRPCVLCGERTRRHICYYCLSDLPATPPLNLSRYLRMTKQGAESFRVCLAPLWYQDSVPRLMHAFKFKGLVEYAPIFISLMAAQIIHFYTSHQLLLPQVLIPVPMTNKKLTQRGFNQSEILTQGLSEVLGIPQMNVLGRKFQNEDTHVKSFKHRMKLHTQDYYRTKLEWPKEVKRVALIDDVVTTGSTLLSVKQALNKRQIVVDSWAAAFTPPPSLRQLDF